MTPVEPLRALSCNDTAATRRSVEVILQRCGFRIVAEVRSAAEAIVAAEVGRPDVVVLDLALTGDLGLTALPRLRAACHGVAVIVVSSFDDMRPAALAAGAFDFVGDADLRALERSLQRLASGGRRAAREDGAETDAVVQVDAAPTSVPTSVTTGSLRTNAPAS